MHKQLQIFGGDWTEQKLDILKEYLKSYNKVLKKQSFTRVYIDAFAGTGYRQDRANQYDNASIFEDFDHEEPQKFLKGSASLALEVDPPFDRYYLVETDKKKIEELEKLRRKYPQKADKIEIVHQDANAFVQKYCKQEDWIKTRAVLFLDPFATQVEWETIRAIAQSKAIDVWILFPLMAVNRLMANKPEKVWRQQLNRIFGTEKWFEAFYRTEKAESLFGQSLENVRKACNFESIADFYMSRLREIFADVAPSYRVFENTRKTPIFQLFFAVGNQNGAPIAIRIATHLLENI